MTKLTLAATVAAATGWALTGCVAVDDAADAGADGAAVAGSEDLPFRGELSASGYATILDAPPAPFTPTEPPAPGPPTLRQRAEQRQFTRVGEFQNRVREEVVALEARLRREEPDNFQTLFFENEGEPSVVFDFLSHGPATLRRYTGNPRFVGRTVRWSQAELLKAQRFMHDMFNADRAIASSGIGAENHVTVNVAISRAAFEKLVRTRGVTIPPQVKLNFDAAPVAPIAGGAPGSDPAVPADIARHIRLFPRDDRPGGIPHAINSQVKLVLKDGCFRAADRDDALVLFDIEARLFVDGEGYLSVGTTGRPEAARVGERVEFAGSIGPAESPNMVRRIHAACGPGKVIKLNPLASAAASRAQSALDQKVRAIRLLSESYGLSEAQARRAIDWLDARERARPPQRLPDGTAMPRPPGWATVTAPPRPVESDADCPAGSSLSFGMCRTPDGHLRPIPDWLAEFLATE